MLLTLPIVKPLSRPIRRGGQRNQRTSSGLDDDVLTQIGLHHHDVWLEAEPGDRERGRAPGIRTRCHLHAGCEHRTSAWNDGEPLLHHPLSGLGG